MTTINTEENRPIILVASRDKLIEMAVTASTSPIINTAADISPWVLPAFWIQLGSKAYRESKTKDLLELTNEKILSKFNQNIKLGIPLVRIEPLEARQSFEFGFGNTPKDGEFYIQHPTKKDFYISPIDFSRAMCSEKEAAFLRLAATLGAKSIKLVSIESQEKEGNLNAKISPQHIAKELGFKASFSATGNFLKEVIKEFNRPSFNKPFIPENLCRWLDIDPDLRTMASDRIEANVSRSFIKLEFSQHLSLGGDISAKIAELGFISKGDFKSLTRSVWSFEIEYFDLSKT